MADYRQVRAAFADLHQDGCFVIPNPWVLMLKQLRFRAPAPTSAGYAFYILAAP